VTANSASRFAGINGVFGTENTDNRTVPALGHTRIGRFTAATLAHPFYGYIDEVRVSDAARSVAWLKAEYNTGNAPGDITVGTPESPGGSSSIVPIVMQMAA
jgi:hypothetical protein